MIRASYALDGSGGLFADGADAVIGRVEGLALQLTPSGLYVSGITYGSALNSVSTRASITNIVIRSSNGVPVTCGRTSISDGFLEECKDAFVWVINPITLNPDSTTWPLRFQIGPPSSASDNNADEPIGVLPCEQNIPSLAGSSC